MKDFQITLDLVRSQKNPPIQIKESDLNSVKFIFTVLDDGVPFDLSNITTVVRLAIRKPSLLTVFQECTITDAVAGKCEITLVNQAYIEVGSHVGELVIEQFVNDVETVVVTNSFEFTSMDAIMDDESLQSTNEWEALHEMMFSYDKKPIIGSGSPNTVVTPEYVGQRYIDQLSMTMYFATTTANDTWSAMVGGGGDGGTGVAADGIVTWNEVSSKPTTFTPSAHQHVWNDISDAPTSMTPTAHSHDWNTGITNKPSSFTPSAHIHAIADITDLSDTLATKLEAPRTSTTDPTGAPDYIGQIHINTTSSEAYIATTDLGGWQSISMDELGGGATAVTWEAIDEKPLTFPPETHTHDWLGNDITNKPTEFPPSDHNHDWSDITTGVPTSFTPSAHQHAWSDITSGVPTEFTPVLASSTIRGGHRVGNGLGMSGEYLIVKAGTGLKVDTATTFDVQVDRTTTDNWYSPKPTSVTALPVTAPTHLGQIAVDNTNKRSYIAEGTLAADWKRIATTSYVDTAKSDITGTILGGHKIWSGTQTEYNGLTPDATTLYFITGA